MTTWKRGDRVYLKHAPDIAGEVRESEDGVVVVISDVCHQRLYVTAEDLEWFTRPVAPQKTIEITAESGFNYGRLASFDTPQTETTGVNIERITINGVTALQEAEAVA